MRTRALLFVVALLGCTEKNEQAKGPALGPPAPVASQLPPTGSTAGAPATARIIGGIVAMEILSDNTVAFYTETTLFAIDPNGATVRTVPIPPKWMAKVDPQYHSDAIVLEHHDTTASQRVTMLKSPTLEVLYNGPGLPLDTPHGGVAETGAHTTLHFVLNGAIKHLAIPGPTRKPASLEWTASKRFGVITYEDDNNPAAQAFDLTTDKPTTEKVEPMHPGDSSKGAILMGETELATADGTVMQIDLATGATRKKKVCNSASFGNPMLLPAGDLFVTCGDDGMTLDPKTFAVKRRYSKIMPGCDNGDRFYAEFDATKPGEMIIPGCGGEARLNLATGKYRCSDAEGLVGAPYGPTLFNGEKRTVPAGRSNLPRCTPENTAESVVGYLDTAKRWKWDTESEPPALVGPSGRVPVESVLSGVVLSADESRVAYELDDRVVVRSLADGKILAEVRR